uniref:WGS project CAEQ00000000 data, annotated contig 1548 n=1 Tax=Trypanosoma congolense (strain IL3000) TaxID=1068625 RepID=F9W714_TRYCI|nr:unnamed protein product [Trypanosoma congolense IL3000]
MSVSTEEATVEPLTISHGSSKNDAEESSTQVSDATTLRTTAVPLSMPRHAKKQRYNRLIEVTDSSADCMTVADVLQHTKETLTVYNGPAVYEEEMNFHPYELYKHGKRKIHTGSVGYSSGTDLVMIREAVSETSDGDLQFFHRRSTIGSVLCLDPAAQRPLTKEEEEKQAESEAKDGKKKPLKGEAYRKYPGVRHPRNRKVRNRLLNSHFATPFGREIMAKYRERQEKGEADADMTPPLRPIFSDLPAIFYSIMDLDEDAQTAALERYGVRMNRTPTAPARDPDSGEVRFQNLNSRLRGELVHALDSEFLTQQIEDLERSFASFINNGDVGKSLTYRFRDGYGRLVCHGVAAYYQLVSQSHQRPDGTKTTVVSWPKRHKKKKSAATLNLPKVTLMSLLRKKRNEMPCVSTPPDVDTPLLNSEKSMDRPETLVLPPALENYREIDSISDSFDVDELMPVYQPFVL